MPTPPKPAGSKAARKRAAAPTTEASHKRAATRNNTPADEGDVLRFAHGAPAWLNVVQRAPGRSNPDRTHTRLHPGRTVHPLGGMPHSTTEELSGSGCASAASAVVPRRAIRRPSFSCSGSADEAQQLDAIVRAAGVTEFWQEQRSNVNLALPVARVRHVHTRERRALLHTDEGKLLVGHDLCCRRRRLPLRSREAGIAAGHRRSLAARHRRGRQPRGRPVLRPARQHCGLLSDGSVRGCVPWPY